MLSRPAHNWKVFLKVLDPFDVGAVKHWEGIACDSRVKKENEHEYGCKAISKVSLSEPLRVSHFYYSPKS